MFECLKVACVGLAMVLAATLPTRAQGVPKDESVTVEGLAGTLVKPTGATTVALIIAGSGATDRNGNGIGGLRTDTYKQLADGLARAGIASLRYDKRGVGESREARDGKPFAEQDVTVETYATDALALAKWLKAKAGFAQVALIGHSEGGLLAMLAARNERIADRIVLLATAGRPLGVVLRKQFERQPIPQDIAAEIERVLVALETGKEPGAIKAPIDQIFRASVQPFMRSVLTLDPVPLAAAQAAPMLVIGGGADLQIGRFDFDPLAGARPGIKSHWEARLTHTMKETIDDDPAQIKTYTDPGLPVMPVVIEQVTAFLK